MRGLRKMVSAILDAEQLAFPGMLLVVVDVGARGRGSPTWEDVQKGRARYITRIEPCDATERGCMFFRGGACTHTRDNYAFPKRQSDGQCKKGYIEWTNE